MPHPLHHRARAALVVLLLTGTASVASLPAEQVTEAERGGDGWHVTHVPYLAEEDVHDEQPDDLDALEAAPVLGAPPQTSASTPGPPTGAPAPTVAVLGSTIEGYAAYDPQRTCSPTAKQGTAALARWLVGRHPGTGSYGISRACDIGGRSEHKEGRAFDWRADIHRSGERAAVDDFLAALFATDAHGNTHALARRMGVMSVVWNRQIWSSYRAAEGWRPYHGPSGCRSPTPTRTRSRPQPHRRESRATTRRTTTEVPARPEGRTSPPPMHRPRRHHPPTRPAARSRAAGRRFPATSRQIRMSRRPRAPGHHGRRPSPS